MKALLLAAAMGFSVLLAYCVAWLNNLLLQDIRRESKFALYKCILQKPSGFFRHRNEGWIEAAVATASQAARTIVYDCLGVIVRAVFFVVFAAALIFVEFPLFGLVFLIAAVIHLYLAYRLARRSSRYVASAVAATADASSEASDMLRNIDSIRGNDMVGYEENRISFFLDLEKKVYSQAQGLLDGNELAQKTFLTLVFNVFIASVAVYGLSDPSSAIMFYIIALLAFAQFDAVGRSLNAVFEQSSKLQTVLAGFDFYQENNSCEEDLGREREFPLVMEVDDLSFGYAGGELIFTNISIKIGPGERLLIAGPSGVGKSTLLKIMTGEIKPQSGNVSVGGWDIHALSLGEKSGLMSVIPQDAKLFNRSLRENASYGVAGVSCQDLEKLLLSLKLDRLRREGPEDWLEASVGKNGLNLSGGEKQRILLARAILRARPMLFLDEVTSALDEEAEAAVFKVLHERLPNATIVAVSHHPHAQLAGYRRLALG